MKDRDGDVSDILIFFVAGRRYGIFTSVVMEVSRSVSISPLPNAPEVIEGIINVRGELVVVFDIRVRLGLPSALPTVFDQLILARAGQRRVALRVDAVEQLRSVSSDLIDDVPETVSSAPFLAGVAKLADGLLLIQDLEAFLTVDETIVLENALPAFDHGEALSP